MDVSKADPFPLNLRIGHEALVEPSLGITSAEPDLVRELTKRIVYIRS